MIIGYDKKLSLATQILYIKQEEYDHNSRTKKQWKRQPHLCSEKMLMLIRETERDREREWAAHRLLFYQLRNNNYKFQLRLELFFTIMFSSNYKHHKTVIKQ